MALELSRLPSRAPCGGSAWDCPTSASTPEGGRDAPGANPAHSILRPARHAHLYAWQGLWQFSQVSAATRFLAERRLTLLGSVVSILACLFSKGGSSLLWQLVHSAAVVVVGVDRVSLSMLVDGAVGRRNR